MFAKTRKYVDEHRTFLAFAAGSVVTSTAIIAAMRGKTVLNVPPAGLELLSQGGGLVYDVKGQTLHLVNLAAVEATL